MEAPALAVLRDAGMGDGFKMRFGYGVGVGYPPTWLDPLEITRSSTQQIHPGSTFVLHACLLDEAASLGVLVGGTYSVTDEGLEQLAGAGAVELTSVNERGAVSPSRRTGNPAPEMAMQAERMRENEELFRMANERLREQVADAVPPTARCRSSASARRALHDAHE